MSDWRRFAEPTERLHAFASGFHATCYVYTGVECGLFPALVEPRSPATLASRLGLHEPYVRRFCEAGLRWGLLAVEGPESPDAASAGAASAGAASDAPRFRLREGFVEPLAEPDETRYVGDLFRFLGRYAREDYAGYPDAFETGERRRVADRGPAFADVIEGTTRGLQDVFLGTVLSDLPAFESRLERGGRLLDVGCGSGSLACRLCERFPEITVVGVDLDADAVERARERAADRGLSDRTTFRVEDAGEVEERIDAAVCFLSLHEIDPVARAGLFDSLGDGLGEDGVVAVFDDVYPDAYDAFDRQPGATGVETQWSELLRGADVPTRREQRRLLALAGCEERTRRPVAERFEAYEGVTR
jgi:SAM-dependent methyltransferase